MMCRVSVDCRTAHLGLHDISMVVADLGCRRRIVVVHCMDKSFE